MGIGGKFTAQIKIVSSVRLKDADGFAKDNNRTLAVVRAHIDRKNASEVWANRAAFSDASVLFRVRRIPGVDLRTDYKIIYNGTEYNIVSVEDIRGRGMYYDIFAREVTPSG